MSLNDVEVEPHSTRTPSNGFFTRGSPLTPSFTNLVGDLIINKNKQKIVSHLVGGLPRLRLPVRGLKDLSDQTAICFPRNVEFIVTIGS